MLENSINCTHEKRPLLPWKVDKVLLQERIKYFNNNYNVGDVAFFYLPYLEDLLDNVDSLKVICLKRDREETIASYMKKTQGRNHWLDHDGEKWRKDPVWDKCYPNYKLPSKEEAIREYWHKYYNYAEWLSDIYSSQVEIYPRDVLNDRGLQKEMFDFIDIDNPNIKTGIKKNES